MVLNLYRQNVKSLTVDDVKGILGTDYEKSSNEVLIATQICHLFTSKSYLCHTIFPFL